MGFTQVSASVRARQEQVLSADNALPERHIVIDTLRKAAPLLRLKAPVIATLDAMLSCLPPQRNHHRVFASNATLTFRRNGISDRTLRRHVATLIELGLLERHDSPNKKRFTRTSVKEGKVLQFGFDLSPLFQRFQEICALAVQATEEQEQLRYLRSKLRALAAQSLEQNPEDEQAAEALRALRRKLTIKDCDRLIGDLESNRSTDRQVVENIVAQAQEMTAKDGQFVRHHHRSIKEHIDEQISVSHEAPPSDPQDKDLSLAMLLSACPEAASFLQRNITAVEDVVQHARMLAPMIGISAENYHAAESRQGNFGTALTIWALVQLRGRVKNTGAYFRSITSGRRSDGFDPIRLITRLAASKARLA